MNRVVERIIKLNKSIKKLILTPMNILYKINPELELKLMFYLRKGYKLDTENPKTYTEKINWMKLYYRNELIPKCVDKYTVRKYVQDCGCGDLLIDLIWDGFNAEDIPFDKLPNQFVIKVTHGSGNNIICKDKSKLNIQQTIRKLNKWIKETYIPCYGEWFYGVVKPRIIIEKFLSENDNEIPKDYKMFYFNNIDGKQDIAFTAVDIGRFVNHKRKIYDRNWSLIPDIYVNNSPYADNIDFKKPINYEYMVECARKLAKPFPHARIDFYVVNDKVYFGEITFMSDAGFGNIRPDSLNDKMGTWIKLPNKMEKKYDKSFNCCNN